MLFLYHAAMSPCVQKVRLTLAEKRLEWSGRLFDLQAKEQLTESFLAINPAGLVPALDHDGVILTESTVICHYLDESFADGPRLTPDAPIDRARMRVWLKRVDDVLHPNTGALVFGAFVRDRFLALSENAREALLAQLPDPARRERQRRLIAEGLDAPDVAAALAAYRGAMDKAEHALATAPWLAGPQLSLADLALLPYVFVCDYLGMACILDERPALAGWYARMKARPSFDDAITSFTDTAEMVRIAEAATRVGPLFCARLAA